MNEDPLSVHIHPSGLHLVIAFNEKINIMNVYSKYLDNKKRRTKEITIRNITCVELSKGGDKIAIAAGNP